jgi:excisionase family DNA binding protein
VDDSDRKASDRPLTVGDVAALLGVANRTVTKYTENHGLPCHRLPGDHGPRRFKLQDVLDWAEDNDFPVRGSIIPGGEGGRFRFLLVGFDRPFAHKVRESMLRSVLTCDGQFEAGLRMRPAMVRAVIVDADGLGGAEAGVMGRVARKEFPEIYLIAVTDTPGDLALLRTDYGYDEVLPRPESARALVSFLTYEVAARKRERDKRAARTKAAASASVPVPVGTGGVE